MSTVYKVKLTKAPSRQLTKKFIIENLSQFCEQEINEEDLLIGPNGKPYLTPSVRPKVCFNLSHSENFLALACSHEKDIGLDIQVHRKFNPKVLERICSPQELASISQVTPEVFFQIWTIKEAALKCLGTGFQFPANKIVIHFDSHEIELLEKAPTDNLIFSKEIRQLKFRRLNLFTKTTTHLVWNFV